MKESYKCLTFSIDGEFINRLAKEWFFIEHKPYEVVEELLLSCMCGTDEPPEKLKIHVQDILLGRAKFQGNSGNDTFELVYLDEDLDKNNIFTEYEKLAKKNKKLEETNNELTKKYLDLYDCLDEWKNSHLDVSLVDDIDLKQLLLDIEARYKITSYLNEKYCDEKENDESKVFFNTGNSLLDSYMKAARYDAKYGWLDPSGNFYEVEWGNHQIWPYYSILCNKNERINDKGEEYDAIDLSNYYNDYNEWLKEHTHYDALDGGADFLVEKGWVLIHSPSNGIPNITRNDIKKLTKKQKEFLFDYFIKLEEPEKAAELYDDIE